MPYGNLGPYSQYAEGIALSAKGRNAMNKIVSDVVKSNRKNSIQASKANREYAFSNRAGSTNKAMQEAGLGSFNPKTGQMQFKTREDSIVEAFKQSPKLFSEIIGASIAEPYIKSAVPLAVSALTMGKVDPITAQKATQPVNKRVMQSSLNALPISNEAKEAVRSDYLAKGTATTFIDPLLSLTSPATGGGAVVPAAAKAAMVGRAISAGVKAGTKAQALKASKTYANAGAAFDPTDAIRASIEAFNANLIDAKLADEVLDPETAKLLKDLTLTTRTTNTPVTPAVTPVFTQVRLKGRQLADLMTGGATGIVDPAATRYVGPSDRIVEVPSGTLDQQKAATFDTVASSLEQTNVSTIVGRQAKELEDVNVALEEKGLDRLPSIMEARLASTGQDPMTKPKTPSTYDRQTIERNIEVGQESHGMMVGARGFKTPDDKAGGHIMENDHLMGTGFATWFIKNNMPKNVTQDWRDEMAGFVEWINSGDNMQRVGRLWNQVKEGKAFEQAKAEFLENYPDAAKAQFNDKYLQYVSDARDSFAKHMGIDLKKSIWDKAWHSVAWNMANKIAQQRRSNDIKEAKALRDPNRVYNALLERGFSEVEAANIAFVQ